MLSGSIVCEALTPVLFLYYFSFFQDNSEPSWFEAKEKALASEAEAVPTSTYACVQRNRQSLENTSENIHISVFLFLMIAMPPA